MERRRLSPFIWTRSLDSLIFIIIFFLGADGLLTPFYRRTRENSHFDLEFGRSVKSSDVAAALPFWVEESWKSYLVKRLLLPQAVIWVSSGKPQVLWSEEASEPSFDLNLMATPACSLREHLL